MTPAELISLGVNPNNTHSHCTPKSDVTGCKLFFGQCERDKSEYKEGLLGIGRGMCSTEWRSSRVFC